MSRIAPISSENATGRAAELFDGIRRKLGVVPNLFATLAVQPKTLETVLGLESGVVTLNAKERQLIALAVGEANGCEYCVAAHTLIGGKVGLTGNEVLDARRGVSSDPKRAALLRFAVAYAGNRGHVDDATYRAFLDAGYTEAQVPEVALAVVQNIFTNYFNNFNGTTVDFPAAPAL